MNLSKQSWHYWLQNKFFNDNAQQSLCSYFWSLLLSMVLIIPYVLIFIPSIPLLYIAYLIFPSLWCNNDNFFEGLAYNYFARICRSIGIYVITYLIVCMVYTPIYYVIHYIGNYGAITEGLLVGAKIGYIILTMLLFILILIHLDDIKFFSKNILVEYIKAKKDKVCPRITWVDKNTINETNKPVESV